MTAWRQIETAPMDGTSVLIADKYAVAIGVFRGGYAEPWRVGCDEAFTMHPTHWMPLPDAPKYED